MMAKNRWKTARGRDLPSLDEFPFTNTELKNDVVMEETQPNPDTEPNLDASEEMISLRMEDDDEPEEPNVDCSNKDLESTKATKNNIEEPATGVDTATMSADITAIESVPVYGSIGQAISDVPKSDQTVSDQAMTDVTMPEQAITEVPITDQSISEVTMLDQVSPESSIPVNVNQQATASANKIIIQAQIPNIADGSSQIIDIQIQPLLPTSSNAIESTFNNEPNDISDLVRFDKVPTEKPVTQIDSGKNSAKMYPDLRVNLVKLDMTKIKSIIKKEAARMKRIKRTKKDIEQIFLAGYKSDMDIPLSKIKLETPDALLKKIKTVAKNVKTVVKEGYEQVHVTIEKRCKFCTKSFNDASVYARHIVFTHMKDFIPCNICGRYFKDRGAKEMHDASHSLNKQTMIKCSCCNIYKKNPKILTEHEKEQHYNETSGFYIDKLAPIFCDIIKNNIYAFLDTANSEIICKSCKAVFKKQSYLNHVKTQKCFNKTGTKVAFCNHCYRAFVCRYELGKHLQLQKCSCGLCNGKLKQNTCRAIAVHQCTKCNKVMNIRTYNAHVTSTCGVQKCSDCNEQFDSMDEQLKHWNAVHNTRHVTGMFCEYCSRVFVHEDRLQKHIQSHEKQIAAMKYVCIVCEKRFKQPRLLLKHYTVHPDVKPYVCKGCEADFKTQTDFKAHIVKAHKSVGKIKIDEKQYITFQPEATAEEETLDTSENVDEVENHDHILTDLDIQNNVEIETEVNPFKCLMCPEELEDYDTLQAHMVLEHPDITTGNEVKKLELKIHKIVFNESDSTSEIKIQSNVNKQPKKLIVINDSFSVKLVDKVIKPFSLVYKTLHFDEENAELTAKPKLRYPEKVQFVLDENEKANLILSTIQRRNEKNFRLNAGVIQTH